MLEVVRLRLEIQEFKAVVDVTRPYIKNGNPNRHFYQLESYQSGLVG